MVDFEKHTIRKRWLHHVTIFLFNVREDFIREAWKGDQHMIDHFEDRLAEIRHTLKAPRFNSPYAIARFMTELDEGNRQKLQHYIETNAKLYN